jgi:hypothetical protein|tara:strand:+ start:392 stop:1081 length:690 start_codon:yes stop_codon:yes gene_type:complete
MLRALRRPVLLCVAGSSSVSWERAAFAEAAPSSANPTAASPQPAASDDMAPRRRGPQPLRTGVALKEIQEGTGTVAGMDMWVNVHYRVTLLGDGSIIDDTRTSGCGDRSFGAPFSFQLGRFNDDSVLRAMHVCVLDMREGGTRRVRTALRDAEFGYRDSPQKLTVVGGMDAGGGVGARWIDRELLADMLMDVEVTLVEVVGKKQGWAEWLGFSRDSGKRSTRSPRSSSE